MCGWDGTVVKEARSSVGATVATDSPCATHVDRLERVKLASGVRVTSRERQRDKTLPERPRRELVAKRLRRLSGVGKMPKQ